MAGKRINLSDLADEPVLKEARVPRFADTPATTAPVDRIAANPLNTRDVQAHPSKIATIADSMRVHGQLQPCTVVTRAAFLRIFPEHEAAIGDAVYVQVTGGRRRAAAAQAGLTALDIAVKDRLADSRAQFVSATAAENIDREDYDAIEEAQAVQLLVRECGSGKGAAEQLSRTPAWVTQRLNLLKLDPAVQALVRSGELPLREVRTLHQVPAEEQLAAVTEWQRQRQAEPELTAVNREDQSSEPEGEETPKPPTLRPSPAAVAIRRLGGTPLKIAAALRAELEPEDLRLLADLLQDS